MTPIETVMDQVISRAKRDYKEFPTRIGFSEEYFIKTEVAAWIWKIFASCEEKDAHVRMLDFIQKITK